MRKPLRFLIDAAGLFRAESLPTQPALSPVYYHCLQNSDRRMEGRAGELGESALSQTKQVAEVVICDDHSSDDSCDIRSYTRYLKNDL